jgi:hypothetical protein
MRGIGFGGGKFWDVVIALRRWTGTGISWNRGRGVPVRIQTSFEDGIVPAMRDTVRSRGIISLYGQKCLSFLLDDPVQSVPVQTKTYT